MLDQSLMQVLQMAAQIRNNPNPEQMFMRMFGNNPEVQGIMNQYKGMNEQQLQGMVQNLCQQRGIDFNAIMQVMRGI
jgi:hemoglobin-like flavoprotein